MGPGDPGVCSGAAGVAAPAQPRAARGGAHPPAALAGDAAP